MEEQELKEVVAEDRKLTICPVCSENYGRWKVVHQCEECYEPFDNGEKMFCDGEGNHYHEQCKPEPKLVILCKNCNHPIEDYGKGGIVHKLRNIEEECLGAGTILTEHNSRAEPLCKCTKAERNASPIPPTDKSVGILGDF